MNGTTQDATLLKIDRAAKRFKELCLQMVAANGYGKVVVELPFENGTAQRRRCVNEDTAED